MDYVRHFGGEVAAFEAAARKAAAYQAAPVLPSCPDWVMTDLVLHVGAVHRFVAHVIGERLRRRPCAGDQAQMGLPDEWAGWLPPGSAPPGAPVPGVLLDWFHHGAAELEERLFLADPDEPVWTWSRDQTVGFWQRLLAIAAAVHRWDAQKAVGTAEPIDSALATDAVRQHFEVIVPLRRCAAKAAPGEGEQFLFRRADGPHSWRVRFTGDDVVLGASSRPRGVPADGRPDIEIAGRASDLALYLWKRPVNGQLDIQGNTRMLRRYFDLVPPLDAGRAMGLSEGGDDTDGSGRGQDGHAGDLDRG